MAKPVHGGLGKGLGALLKNTDDAKDKIQLVPVSDIQANPFQPRKEFDAEALEELMNSIKEYGVLQPLLVRKLLHGYELIAGERRLRASKLAGLEKVPVLVRNYTDAQVTEIALIENLQRCDLNAIEEAEAYDRLLTEFGLTQEILAQKVGRSRSHIANFLRLLRLAPRVQEYIINGSITMGQAKPLLALEEESLQLEAAEYIIAEDLSAREAEELVKKIEKSPTYLADREEGQEREAAADKSREIFVVEAEDRLKLLLGTNVKIKPGKKKSKIEIEFYSAEDLDRIIETLTEEAKRLPSQQIARNITV
ncbi:MAG: ParB/RepB/Spo0J family partition protein [Selenomonadaceae bacterium]